MRDVRSQGSNAGGKDAVNADSSGGPTTNSVPAISLPKGGGAIRGIGEKFGANPVTGTGSLNVPIATSPGRSGFGPQLSLSYDSGAGNGPVGLGWNLSLPAITRKTDKGLPRYQDADESDVFILSGAEDLVPVLHPDGSRFEDDTSAPGFMIHRYRPRIEGLFARIERWTNQATGEIRWRSITRDNITTMYGKTAESRITDPNDSKGTFTWLICESYDDKGNAIVYEYAGENDENVDRSQVNERNRQRTANRYLKRINYGNKVSRLIEPDLTQTKWMFEVVFDYDEDHYEELDLDPTRPEAEQHRLVRAAASPGLPWTVRPDPFSTHRAGFEVRTYRRCRRVLMFHRFDELGDEPYLVRSTEFDYADFDYSQPTTVEDELAHVGSTRFASFIRGVTQSGYVRDDSQPVLERNGVTYVTYLKKSLPPLEFEYSKAAIQDDIREIDAESLENLPIGLDGAAYQWVDLDGEGVSGILTEQGDAWFYKPNLGEGRFGSLQTLRTLPASSGSGQKHQFLDLAGDGHLDVVQFSGPVSGFYERTDDGGWQSFTTFSSLPNLDWGDPNLRFVDLTGDGHADILITEDDAFTWLPSLAEEGFGSFELVRQALDEEKGPKLVFADGTQSIYLADMSADGLADLVRIRNGEVCYWPNLGYSRFGAKVTMDHAPRFDNPDQFDQRQVRLADIDGSGTTDIIYLGRDNVALYFNQSGNLWSEPRKLSQFPRVDNISSVMTADLLGNGTACLVWSSPLPRDVQRPMRYIDLMGGQKPHLLISSVNNLGSETRVTYAPSTKFYLADKLAGKPWITKIPFPVHVVERVETYDYISRNRFVTRYAYHHGYFDGVEREFRGFGMVEQRDTEEFAALSESQAFPVGTNVDESSHVPPVLTRTWFHTGVFLNRNHISDFFAGLLDATDAGEYYREPGLTDSQARELLLDDTSLPGGLTVEEEREACRALKGSMLRHEVYALDGTSKEKHPYTVTEQNFTIRQLQPQAENRYAVFFTHARESISYHYEREPSDPRITHALTLEVDEFGNVLKSAAVSYGRRQPDPALEARDQAKQAEVLITYTENDFTNSVEASDDHRTPLPCESRTYELTGYAQSGASGRFQIPDFVHAAGNGLIHVFSSEINYEEKPSGGKQRRLIEQVRTYYRPNDLGVSRSDPLALLPPRELESLALPGETYKLALTPSLVAAVYGGRVTDAMLTDEGRYVHSEGDAKWWIPSGSVFYSPDATDTAVQEVAQARAHFFLTRRYRDPFHTNAVSTESFVSFDAYDLLILETRDALGNRVTVGERDAVGNLTAPGHDYRVLQPRLVMDPNRNRSAVAFDALGLVVGMALMGTDDTVGDTLSGFEPDPTQSLIEGLHDVADPNESAPGLLMGATRRIIYDLDHFRRTQQEHPNDPTQWLPVYAATLARETHVSDPLSAEGLTIQISFSYSDGFGREIQKKIQAEPGLLVEGGPVVSPRWVGGGWTIFNNKGKPVRQYEPFFSQLPEKRHRFEFGVQVGVSPIFFYDPVERVVATLHPNHSYEKVVFDPWRQINYDMNDTVAAKGTETGDPRSDTDIKGHVAEYFKTQPNTWQTWHQQRIIGAKGALEKSAAEKAVEHANTPTTAHFDTLGRPFLTLAHNGFELDGTTIHFPTRVHLDIEGNQRQVRDAIEQNGDAQGRVVMRYDYDMLGNRIHQTSMEAGRRWMLDDVSGKPIRAWDSRGHTFRTEYDSLRRPLRHFVTGADPANPNKELLTERLVYGEQHPEDELRNLRDKLYLHLDQASVITNEAHDFKGNLLRTTRRLAREYKQAIDWSAVDTAVPINFTAKLNAASLESAFDPLLEAETFTSRTSYDAFNRPVQVIAPRSDQPGAKRNVIQPVYNEANLLERVDVWLDHSTEPAGLLDAATIPPSPVGVGNIDYDAKGQRLQIEYKNGTTTRYAYDPETFRLIHLYTRRGATFTEDCDNPQPPPLTMAAPEMPPLNTPCGVQNLRYNYDPVGNITHIRDDAQQTIYFRNKRVEASNGYTYDAIYRLIEATGREHLGQVGGAPIPHSHSDAPRVGIDWSANDGNAMGTYTERYVYDAVGNFLSMKHDGNDPANPGWTRIYAYNETSLIEDGTLGTSLKTSNRLSNTTVGSTNLVTERYVHDAHGNMIRMPHLGGAHPDPNLHWDYKDQLHQAGLGGGGIAYYMYDATGQRTRKVWEKALGVIEERIYLGGFEVFRRRRGAGTVSLERETLHVMDDKQCVALVEARTEGTDPAPEQVIRYQMGNHLGSAILELDDQAQIISYEEYSPYGSTLYQAARSQTETPKRYRYSGKERDEESGLNYHGARYYAPWLARWASCDPLTEVRHRGSAYSAMMNNPVKKVDLDGKDAIIVAFPDYLVDTEIATKKIGPITIFERKQPLGHGAVILIDNKTGFTKYYEYGRYPTTDGTKGKVRSLSVPNVVMGKDGKPTPESLKKLLDKVSLQSGQGTRIEAAYIKSDKFKHMNDYAQKKLKESNPGNTEYNKKREPYALTSNNCGTFAADVVNQDPDVAKPSVILNPTPPNIVDEYQEEGHEPIKHPAPAGSAAKQPVVKPKQTQPKQNSPVHKKSKPTEHKSQKPLLHHQH
jgi:RHS repeat-associated protein